jgi:hypothetical protein
MSKEISDMIQTTETQTQTEKKLLEILQKLNEENEDLWEEVHAMGRQTHSHHRDMSTYVMS